MRPTVCIAVSGPKDGVGRTTLICHLAVALLQVGRRAGVVDLDSRDGLLTDWMTWRLARAERMTDLCVPAMPEMKRVRGLTPEQQDAVFLRQWPAVLDAMADACDVLIVDAPTALGDLSKRVHQDADVILTTVAESPADIDRLFERGVDGAETGRPADYGRLVWEARRRRAQRSGSQSDWLLVRTRGCGEDAPPALSTLISDHLDRAERLLGARRAASITETPAWRAGLDEGLTLLDQPYADAPWTEAPRGELRNLMIVLKLAALEGVSFAF